MSAEYNDYDSEQAEPPRPRKKSIFWKMLFGIFFAISILANLFMLIIVVAMAAFFASGSERNFMEKTLSEGPGNSKIAVISIEGVITGELSRQFASQIKMAEEDDSVRAVIVRVESGGGGVAASDEIHNQIMQFKKQTGKPVVAFMQTIAASGGYYASVACDKILAEPTVITGSIGVIMGHFVLQNLFEQKLGIKSVVIKSSQKKNWPTTFEPVTQEQRKYLSSKLIMPAYRRFVKIVAAGRNGLDYQQVKALADGSIYNADEALSNGLIDKIGYFDDAVKQAESLAGIKKARVIEYTRPFSIESFISRKAAIQFNMNSIYKMTTPQLMYLWDAGIIF